MERAEAALKKNVSVRAFSSNTTYAVQWSVGFFGINGILQMEAAACAQMEAASRAQMKAAADIK